MMGCPAAMSWMKAFASEKLRRAIDQRSFQSGRLILPELDWTCFRGDALRRFRASSLFMISA
ncbi:hypothetical protein RSWS8N_16149 [Cereibacter sphaeroides WS8N]|nr:hypothetical protein RSWS8N_16149 [Cereibacter sphaeroides WS8N]